MVRCYGRFTLVPYRSIFITVHGAAAALAGDRSGWIILGFACCVVFLDVKWSKAVLDSYYAEKDKER